MDQNDDREAAGLSCHNPHRVFVRMPELAELFSLLLKLDLFAFTEIHRSFCCCLFVQVTWDECATQTEGATVQQLRVLQATAEVLCLVHV